MPLFRAALDDDATGRTVAAMTEEARGLGLPGTPSFTINGKAIDYQGYDSVATAIEAELAALGVQ
jgi:protein-disulfide isomerase